MPIYRYKTQAKWGPGIVGDYREVEAASAEAVLLHTDQIDDLHDLDTRVDGAWLPVLDHLVSMLASVDRCPHILPANVHFERCPVEHITPVDAELSQHATALRATYGEGGPYLGYACTGGSLAGWTVLAAFGGYPRAAAHNRGWALSQGTAAAYLCHLANLILEAQTCR